MQIEKEPRKDKFSRRGPEFPREFKVASKQVTAILIKIPYTESHKDKQRRGAFAVIFQERGTAIFLSKGLPDLVIRVALSGYFC